MSRGAALSIPLPSCLCPCLCQCLSALFCCVWVGRRLGRGCGRGVSLNPQPTTYPLGERGLAGNWAGWTGWTNVSLWRQGEVRCALPSVSLQLCTALCYSRRCLISGCSVLRCPGRRWSRSPARA
ncbi:hypothetical protein B0T19DRAFT_166900 [Cercophora scortea]|uniref:Secreted protein n=1 Tax=Cercophora scortea TaxID=314031 RepID=A0AAE0IM49_9PEZI|nr:hypothetical protein B0T19DRAFT_166900 [Cercophora scortea]